MTVVSAKLLDALMEQLYAASVREDRAGVGPALDSLLEYVERCHTVRDLRSMDALYDALEPARLVRAVGHTLLAATWLIGDRSAARAQFALRFVADLELRQGRAVAAAFRERFIS